VLTATCGSAIQTERTVASSGQQFSNFCIAGIDIISAKYKGRIRVFQKQKGFRERAKTLRFTQISNLACLNFIQPRQYLLTLRTVRGT
jgi:hypothetical protein